MLPQNSPLGKLKVVEVYEYFDMPTLYCAKNTMGAYFVVYWCDVKDDKEGWLYLPVSLEKLNLLRRSQISFHKAYHNSEQGYYLAYVGVEPAADEVIYLSESEVVPELLPPDDYFVESIDVTESSEEDWVFRILVQNEKAKKGRVKTEVSSSALDLVRDLIEALMHQVSESKKKKYSLYSLSATYGSFDVKIGASDNDVAIKSIEIFKKVVDADVNSLNDLLFENKIDPYQIENIYAFILSKQLNISIIPKLSTELVQEIVLDTEGMEDKISLIKESNYASLPSIKVPQANDLDTVIQLVEYVWNGTPLSPENFDDLSSLRQVAYYRDAAYSLGLLTRSGVLTSEGHFFLSKPDKETRYKVLANLFELSDFGWNWMKKYGKSSMNDLAPSTAEEFVLESVPTLSESTAKRRSKTLAKWLVDLQPYHIEYNGEDQAE